MADEPIVAEPVSPVIYPAEPKPQRPTRDLCPIVHFVPQYVVKDGVGVIVWISRHTTLAVNERVSGAGRGMYKHIFAEAVVNHARGTVQLAVRTGNQQCVGGFGNVGGRVRGMVRSPLEGTIVQWSSMVGCIPV